MGVRPDLTTMGKIIGGGLPVGAFGGRADVMEVFDPRSPHHLHHSGTFNGNLMTMAAGCVTLDLLTHCEIERINALGERLADGLRRSLAERPDLQRRRERLRVSGARELRDGRRGSQVLRPEPGRAPWRPPSISRRSTKGVYFAPRGFMNTSTAMDEQVVDDALEACSRALERVVLPQARSLKSLPSARVGLAALLLLRLSRPGRRPALPRKRRTSSWPWFFPSFSTSNRPHFRGYVRPPWFREAAAGRAGYNENPQTGL